MQITFVGENYFDVSLKDIVFIADPIRMYDMVTAERTEENTITIHIVNPREYMTNTKTLYQVQSGDDDGKILLREVRMLFSSLPVE